MLESALDRARLYAGPHVALDEGVRRRITLAMAVQELAERWKIDGCKRFDEGDSPPEVAEAAGILRCALELSHLLDTLTPDAGKSPRPGRDRFVRAGGTGRAPRERRRKKSHRSPKTVADASS